MNYSWADGDGDHQWIFSWGVYSNTLSLAKYDVIGHHLLLLNRSVILGVATFSYFEVLFSCIHILIHHLETLPSQVKPSDDGVDDEVLSFLLSRWSSNELVLVLVWGLYSLHLSLGATL